MIGRAVGSARQLAAGERTAPRRPGARDPVPAAVAHRPLQLPLQLLRADGAGPAGGPALAARARAPRRRIREARHPARPAHRRRADAPPRAPRHRAGRRGHARHRGDRAHHERPRARDARASSCATRACPRLNVSLDTLDPAKLQRISGRAATLERIVSGIEAAFRVRVRVGEAERRRGPRRERGRGSANLARFAWRFGATARFIELMPFGPGKPVPTAEVKRLLEAQGIRLEPDASRGWGPAYHMRGTSRRRAAGR